MWVSKRATPFGASRIGSLGERTVMWATPTYKCALSKLRDGESVARKSVISITSNIAFVHGFAKETASLLLEFEEILKADLVLVSKRPA